MGTINMKAKFNIAKLSTLFLTSIFITGIIPLNNISTKATKISKQLQYSEKITKFKDDKSFENLNTNSSFETLDNNLLKQSQEKIKYNSNFSIEKINIEDNS